MAVLGIGQLSSRDVVLPVDLAARQQLGDLGEVETVRPPPMPPVEYPRTQTCGNKPTTLCGEHVQMRGQTGGGDWLEKLILEDVQVGVVPVVRNFMVIVPSHHITSRGSFAAWSSTCWGIPSWFLEIVT